MSLFRRGRIFWTSFSVDGVSYRKTLRTTVKREAIIRERGLIAEAKTGSLSVRESGPKTLFAAIDAYVSFKKLRWSRRTLEWTQERTNVIKKHFKDIPLRAITAHSIREYQKNRSESGIKNRTINMDVAVLSRVLKLAGRWTALERHVQMLPEGESTIGYALTDEEHKRLLQVASSRPEWEHVYCAAKLAAQTSLRRVEVIHLKRKDVDLSKNIISIHRSKNASGHRTIPLIHPDALAAVSRMVSRCDELGFTSPDHYLWFACQWGKFDPTKPTRKWDTAWRSLRKEAGLPSLRFHDLRHTFISRMAEAGIADATIMSISGHLSKRMLQHYTHIGLKAKQRAFEDYMKHCDRNSEESNAEREERRTIQ